MYETNQPSNEVIIYDHSNSNRMEEIMKRMLKKYPPTDYANLQTYFAIALILMGIAEIWKVIV